MEKRFQSLFISHGAPTLAIEPGPASDFLRLLGQELGHPRAIIVASAHWETAQPAVAVAAHPDILYDFGGFPDALYRIRYPAPGDPALARTIVRMLTTAGLPATPDTSRGFDHGVWVPLSLMYPDADVPVIEIAIQPERSPAHHLALGRALAPLRDEGVLIIGSGSSTHNLREISFIGGKTPEWASSFDTWLAESVTASRTESLLNYMTEAPYAIRNHPTLEHFLPFFVALGAAGSDASGRVLYRDFTFGSLSMASFAWN